MHGDTLVPLRHSFLGEWVSKQRMSRRKNLLSDERIRLLDKVGFIWNPSEQEWQDNYQLLKQYKIEHGKTNVPNRDAKLGRWVGTQRAARKKGMLSKDHIQLLDKIGFVWDQLEQDWQENYQLLKQYLEDHGDTNVPKRHSNLGKWVGNQRTAKKKEMLSKDRIQLLDKIGFVWDQFEQDWQGNYQLLMQYSKDVGDTKVPKRHPILGRWVMRQRIERKQNKLSEERIRLLDQLGFIWDASIN